MISCLGCISVETRLSLSASDKDDCGHHAECTGCHDYHDVNMKLISEGREPKMWHRPPFTPVDPRIGED